MVFRKRRFRRFRKRGVRPLISRMVPRIPDIHSVDVPTTTIALFSGGNNYWSITTLNGVRTGTSLFERTGNRVNPLSIELWGSAFNKEPGTSNPGAPTAPLVAPLPVDFRLMLVYDRQPNGVVPGLDQILIDFDSAGNGTADVYAGRNPAYTSRFLTLYDKLHTFNPLQATSGNNTIHSFNVFRSLKGLICQYSGTTAAQGSIAAGSVYVLFVARDIGQADTNPLLVRFSSRFRFLDN